jgi:hypothetical protein
MSAGTWEWRLVKTRGIALWFSRCHGINTVSDTVRGFVCALKRTQKTDRILLRKESRGEESREGVMRPYRTFKDRKLRTLKHPSSAMWAHRAIIMQ